MSGSISLAMSAASSGSTPPSIWSSAEMRRPTGKPGEVSARMAASISRRNPGAVLQVAAVAVFSQVGGGGEELSDQIAVSAVELHSVEPALLAPAGRGGERSHQLVDHGLGQLLGNHPHHRAGDGAMEPGAVGSSGATAARWPPLRAKAAGTLCRRRYAGDRPSPGRNGNTLSLNTGMSVGEEGWTPAIWRTISAAPPLARASW